MLDANFQIMHHLMGCSLQNVFFKIRATLLFEEPNEWVETIHMDPRSMKQIFVLSSWCSSRLLQGTGRLYLRAPDERGCPTPRQSMTLEAQPPKDTIIIS